MNRRAFLRSVSIAAASGLLLPEIARELIAPKRTIFLPTVGEWIPKWVDASNGLIDTAYIEREMLSIAEARVLWPHYESVIEVPSGRTLQFRRPIQYRAHA